MDRVRAAIGMLLGVASVFSWNLPAAIKAKPVVIALAGNLSAMSDNMWNPFSDYFRKGIYLALEEMRGDLQRAGLQVSIREFDLENDKTRAIDAAQAITKSEAVAAIGFPYSAELLLAGPILNSARVPTLSPSATADRIGAIGRYVRTSTFNDTFQGAMLARLVRKQGLKSVGIVSAADCAYCQSLRKAFLSHAASQGCVIRFDEQRLESELQRADVLGEIGQRARNLRMDGILVPNYERLSATIISGLYDNGVRPKYWIGGDGWGAMSELFLQLVGKRPVEGITVAHWHADAHGPGNSKFLKLFRDAHGKEPIEVTPVAYDAMRLLLSAVMRADRKDREGVQKALEEIQRFEGVVGSIRYAEGTRIPSKDAVVLRLQNGKVIPAGRVE